MGLRRGRSNKAGPPSGADDDRPDDLTAELADGRVASSGANGGTASDAAPEEPPALRRPLDESEAGDDDSVMPRLNLGSMLVPVFADMEVRVELNDQKQPVAATLLHSGSAVQLLAFAAPRGEGIWDDIRAEIAESVRSDGGSVEEADGVFGAELRVKTRVQVQPGQFAEQHLRFVGFDGPRWFVRGVFSGPAATNAQQAAALEAVVLRVIVARGTDPMAPRDALPLQLPHEVAGVPGSAESSESAESAESADSRESAGSRPSIDPFVRGPEITEIQ